MTMRPLDPNNPIAAMMPHGMIVDLPQQKKSGGMFGGGGIGQAIAGMIGDYLLQRSGMHPMYAPIMQMRQQMQLEDMKYQRQREDSREDWLWKKEHEGPDYGEFERALIASGVQPGTPGWADAMQRRANNMLDPIVMLPQGPVPRSLIVGNPGPPAKPVGTLTPIPDDGGPTPPASGGFPGY